MFEDVSAVWVLDHLKTLLKNASATTDPVLDSQLWSEKVIFFLHLLGLDTMGHSYGPHSKVQSFFRIKISSYYYCTFRNMENIQVVDNIVREAEDCPLLFYD